MNIKSLKNNQMMYCQHNATGALNYFNFREKNYTNDSINNGIESTKREDLIHEKISNHFGFGYGTQINLVNKFPKLKIQKSQHPASNSVNDLDTNKSRSNEYSYPGIESKEVKQQNHNSFENFLKDLNKDNLSNVFNKISKPLVLENRHIKAKTASVARQVFPIKNLNQDNQPRNKNEDVSTQSPSMEHLNKNICNSNSQPDKVLSSKIIKEAISKNSETERYEQKTKRILQYYYEKYWSQEQTTPQRILEQIPNNLSVHRLKLEKLKQFNNRNIDRTSYDLDAKRRNNKTTNNKTVHFDKESENFNSDNQDDFSKPYSPLHSDIDCCPHSHAHCHSNSSSCDYVSVRSILKNKDQDETNPKMNDKNSAKIQNVSNEHIVPLFKHENFEKLKHQNTNRKSTNVINKSCTESQKEILLKSGVNLTDEKNIDQHCLVKDALTIKPIIPENKLEENKPKQVISCSGGPSRLNRVCELPINKEQKFYTKSIIESNKKFQMLGSPLQVCNFRNLRDDDYTKAWKIKL